MMKAVPLPSSLWMSIEPPCAKMISRQMLSPRPTPSLLFSCVSYSFPKFMNNFFQFSGEMPQPVSRKIIQNLMMRSVILSCSSSFQKDGEQSSASSENEFSSVDAASGFESSSRSTSIVFELIFRLEILFMDRMLSRMVTSPPAGVNLILFVRKFNMNWPQRLASEKSERKQYLWIGDDSTGPLRVTFLCRDQSESVSMQHLTSLMRSKCSSTIQKVLLAISAQFMRSRIRVIIILACPPIFWSQLRVLPVKCSILLSIYTRYSRSCSRVLMQRYNLAVNFPSP